MMARAALGLSVKELAGLARVAPGTVTRLEKSNELKPRTVEAIQAALEAAGIEFTFGDAPGVRLRTGGHLRTPSSIIPALRPADRVPAGRAIELGGAVIDHCSHVCAFVGSREDEYNLLLPFAKNGLGRGDRFFQILDADLHASHTNRLTEAGIDVSRYLGSGQLELRAWEQTYLAPGHFDQFVMMDTLESLARSGMSQGSGMTRLWANMEWTLKELPGVEELAEFESRLNGLLPQLPIAAVCTYDLTRFSATAIFDILRAHPYVIIGGTLRQNAWYVPPDTLVPELRSRNIRRQRSKLFPSSF
jgi:transcriptional regulator with XRE-family HTH domain